MKDERKWCLKSGRYVEDILYEIGLSQQKERYISGENQTINYLPFYFLISICHSFTIDLSDSNIQEAFDEEEWNEVKSTNVKEKIQLKDDVKQLLEALNKVIDSLSYFASYINYFDPFCF
jgi:hypothetical protein